MFCKNLLGGTLTHTKYIHGIISRVQCHSPWLKFKCQHHINQHLNYCLPYICQHALVCHIVLPLCLHFRMKLNRSTTTILDYSQPRWDNCEISLLTHKILTILFLVTVWCCLLTFNYNTTAWVLVPFIPMKHYATQLLRLALSKEFEGMYWL